MPQNIKVTSELPIKPIRFRGSILFFVHIVERIHDWRTGPSLVFYSDRSKNDSACHMTKSAKHRRHSVVN